MSVIKISSANEERQANSIRYLESRGIAVHEGQYDGLEKVARIMRDQDAYMATITTMRDAIVSALRKFAATWKNASHGWVIVIVPDNGTGRSSIASHVVSRADAVGLQHEAASRSEDLARKQTGA